MRTDKLKTNQIARETYDWYLGYLASIDDKDIARFGAYLAEDCVMIQNNREPVQGKREVLAQLAWYWTTFRRLEHDLLNIYGDDRAFALEALNHYERLDGGQVSVRAVAMTDRDDSGLVSQFRFYTDVTPVFDVEVAGPVAESGNP